MSDPAAWPPVLALLKRTIDERELPLREAARQVGISHTALRDILTSDTGTPFAKTQRQVRQWLRGLGYDVPWVAGDEVVLSGSSSDKVPSKTTTGSGGSSTTPPAASSPAIADLLNLLQAESPATFRLLGVLLRSISDRDEQRMVAYTVIKAVKESLLSMRLPIPARLFELEREFIASSD